jgi:hypothetical protein
MPELGQFESGRQRTRDPRRTKMKTILTLLLFGTALLDAQAPVKRVHTVYVDELHFPSNPDYDGLVRSKLISYLVQHCGSDCTVMEAVDKEGDVADAILTGTVLVQTPDSRHYRVQGAMRLVDKDGAVLWADTVYSSTFARGATSSFADNVAKKLTSFLVRR